MLAGPFLPLAHAADMPLPPWRHLSSKNGDLPEPNGGKQQTACVVFDKPYTWDTSRVDLWLNQGVARP